MTPQEQIEEKVATLQEQLLANHPGMPVLLRDIHNRLKADPDVVTLLSEEAVGIIVSGLQKQTQTVILNATMKKGTGKALKKTTVADL
jgi:CTP:molybdopterin cytidylyltransferase MocA